LASLAVKRCLGAKIVPVSLWFFEGRKPNTF